MKHFHTSSFLIGVGGAIAVVAVRHRLRPVFVELAAAGLHLGKIAFAVIDRQREHAEDLWAEIDERVRQRAHGRGRAAGHEAEARGRAAAPTGNGAGAPLTPETQA